MSIPATAAAGGARSNPDHSRLWVIPEDEPRLAKDIEHQVFVKMRFYRELLRAIKEADARTVLEVGAGSAIDSCWLAARSDAAFHALDSTETAMRFAGRVGRHFPRPVQYHLGDAFAAPFADRAFDLLFHQGLLEHFEDPVPLLEENLRILRPGGLLVVDVPQRYSLYTVRKRRKMRRGAWPWGWEREYTAGEMRRLGAGLPMELVRLSSWGYDFYTSILRYPWAKLSRKNPLRDRSLFRGLDAIYRNSAGRLWEGGWEFLESRLGPRFMMNVTGIYRRTR